MKFHFFGLISQREHCTQLFENVVLFVLQWYYLDYRDSLGLDEIVQRIGVRIIKNMNIDEEQKCF